MPSSSNFQTDGSVDSQTMVVRLAPRKIGPKPKNATGFLVGTRTMSKSPERDAYLLYSSHNHPKEETNNVKGTWPVSLVAPGGSSAPSRIELDRRMQYQRLSRNEWHRCISSYCVKKDMYVVLLCNWICMTWWSATPSNY